MVGVDAEAGAGGTVAGAAEELVDPGAFLGSRGEGDREARSDVAPVHGVEGLGPTGLTGGGEGDVRLNAVAEGGLLGAGDEPLVHVDRGLNLLSVGLVGGLEDSVPNA